MGKTTTPDEYTRYGSVSRRRILQLSGLGGTALLAGCSSRDDNSSENGNSDENGNGDESDDRGPIGPDDLEYIDVEGSREVVEVTGTGGGFDGETDEGHFYYDEVSGDFDVAVHCTDLEGISEYRVAGLMVRDSLDPAAPMVFLRRDPDGEAAGDVSPAWISWRADQDGDATYVDATNAEWLRLTREDDTLTLYGSMTSTDWERVGQFTISDDVALGEDVQVGLAATRNEDGAEQEVEATATATFKDLTGFDPSESVDIGEPNFEGGVTTRDDVPHVTTLEPDTESDDGETMTLSASVHLPEASETEYSFEYRQFAEDEWTTTEPGTISESGWIEETIDVDTRRVYLLRTRADVPNAPDDVTLTTGTTLFRASATTDSSEAQESFSPGVSQFGPADGFADPAPWLDDSTPIITITEPTREALFEAFHVPVERLVVFETSGVVDLEGEQLSIRSDGCYVAGQTAPSPGITFVNAGLQIAADDCVVQHVRCRPGDYEKEQGWGPTSMQVQDTRENNVVDHCTATWGVDENLTIGRDTVNTTLSNCLVAEGLSDSTHAEGVHSMGSLINNDAKNVALLGNVWAHNRGRNPLLKTGTESVVVNNVSYHFDYAVALMNGTVASIEGNVILRADEGDPVVGLDPVDGEPPDEPARVYFEDTHIEPEMPLDVGTEPLEERPLWLDGLDPLPSEQVLEHNRSEVGARPADRTHQDERILEQVATGEGGFVDSQDDVGGYPDLAVNTHTLNLPDSGTRTWLREWSASVEKSP